MLLGLSGDMHELAEPHSPPTSEVALHQLTSLHPTVVQLWMGSKQ